MSTPSNVTSIPKVVVKKNLRAPREKVFDAWTKPELMRQWFYPGPWSSVTKNDFRVGGTYSHEMIPDQADASCGPDGEKLSGKSFLHTGEYLEIKRPEKLVFTWNSPWVKNTRVTVELFDKSGSTDLVLTHELLETEEQRKSHTDGWNGCLGNLEKFIA